MIWGTLHNSRLSRLFADHLGRLSHYPSSSASGTQRNSSNSAVKHLLPGNATISQLYLHRKAGHSPEHLNAILVNFVRTRKFGAATQFRIRLIRDGIKITPDPVYEQAAISCLRWNDIKASLSEFESWFSLIPACNPMDLSHPPLLDTKTDHLPDLRRVVFASPSTRLAVVLSFGILSARKGYIQPTFNEILPVLIRYAPANVGVYWLREMERAILQYSASTPYFSQTVNHFRDLSIKVCCQAGWLSHAMTIMRKNPEFELSTSTRTLLKDALRTAGREKDMSRLDSRVRVSNPWRLRTAIPSGDAEATPRISWNSRKLPSVSMLSRHSVAIEVRSINRRLRDSEDLITANITIFLSRLRDVGGAPRIMQWLRERALLAGPSCGLSWLEGEFRYHLTQRSYDEVLRLYLARFNTEAQLPSLFSDQLSVIAAFHRIPTPLTTPPNFILSERWMVLKSIIRLIPTLPKPLVALQALYDTYCLEKVNHNEAYNVRPAFIDSFGECGALSDAVRVLKGSGKAPYLKEVEALAGVLAHAGRAEKALALLRHVESGKMETTLFDGRVMCLPARPSIYERVISGFVRAALLRPALEAESMMKKKLGQNFSQNKIHIKVIEALRALEAQCTPN